MQPTKQQISEAFSKGDFKFAYPHLSDDVQWNIVGDKLLNGKTEVVEFCDKTAAYFSSVTTKFSTSNMIIDGDGIAIDGTARFTNKENKSTHVSSCDVYRFKDDKLHVITSYCIVTSKI